MKLMNSSLHRAREPEEESASIGRPVLDDAMSQRMSETPIHPHPGSAEEISSWITAQYYSHYHNYFGDRVKVQDDNRGAKSNNNNNNGSWNVDPEEYRTRLDAISPETAGRVNMGEIRRTAKYQLQWASEIIEVLYDRNKLVHPTKEEEAEKAERKGVPKSEFVSSKLMSMFDRLREVNMMERLEPNDPRLKEGEDENLVASALMFMVEKMGTECEVIRGENRVIVPLLRLIADARRGNTKLLNNLTYNIFTLDSLFQTVSNTFRKTERTGQKKWFCINADLRHWFHQIELPVHLRNLFQFRFKSGVVYRPRLLPMGWFLSPPVAQAVTWTLALSCGKDGKVPGLSRINQLKQMPPWLPFDKDAGGIFVLQDNVFIITDNEELAKKWSIHLNERAKFFNAEFKGVGPEVVEISQENKNSVEFNGIDFFYNGWRTAHRQDRPDEFIGDGPYSFTHRRVSRLLGEILWDMRVRRIAGIENVELMQLFSRNSPPSPDEWDDINDKFTQKDYALLRENLEITRQHRFCECQEEWFPERESTLTYAVDASLGDNKLKQRLQAMLGVVSVNIENGGWEWENVHQPHVYIGEAELEAIVWAVEKALHECPNVKMIIIATDSLCAKGWVERVYSDRPYAQALLRYLWFLIKDLGIRLSCIYIRTDHNLADIPTRIGRIEKRNSSMVDWRKGLEDFNEVKSRIDATFGLLRSSIGEILRNAGIEGKKVVRTERKETEMKEVAVEKDGAVECVDDKV